jgi:hypothetical protein
MVTWSSQKTAKTQRNNKGKAKRFLFLLLPKAENRPSTRSQIVYFPLRVQWELAGDMYQRLSRNKNDLCKRASINFSVI